jgi:DNA-binding protein Fis
MNTANIRQQLHNYLEVADDKKLNAIYTMVADEIKETIVEYTPEFKADLDSRVNYYLNGGKMISPAAMNKRLQALRKKRK